MFIAIVHEVHDSNKFHECAGRVFPLPEEFHIHQFLPASNLRQAVCLYEAPSVEALRHHIDGTLGEASTQRYFPVEEQQAVGLPAHLPAGSTVAAEQTDGPEQGVELP